MAEFDLDKMTDRVVEKALNEFTYNGKTLREWVEIIVAQDLLAITELEKIKTEMLGQKMFYTPDIEIIDNHIKELKGENK